MELSSRGIEQAREVVRQLLTAGLTFDVAFRFGSEPRAIRTIRTL